MVKEIADHLAKLEAGQPLSVFKPAVVISYSQIQKCWRTNKIKAWIEEKSWCKPRPLSMKNNPSGGWRVGLLQLSKWYTLVVCPLWPWSLTPVDGKKKWFPFKMIPRSFIKLRKLFYGIKIHKSFWASKLVPLLILQITQSLAMWKIIVWNIIEWKFSNRFW